MLLFDEMKDKLKQMVTNYGRVKYLLRSIQRHEDLSLNLILGASTLLDRFGKVIDIIRKDGFEPVRSIYYVVEGETLSSSGASNTLFNVVLVIAGFVLLVVGGEMTIENGVEVAQLMGVSEVVIGMFVLAVGTSLPELVTSAIAAYKKETDLALGNIVGSNIFNSLVVLPAAAIIRPLPIPIGGDWDLAIGGLFVLVMIPLFLFSNAKLGRLAGVGLLFGYFFYLYLRFNF